MRFLNSHTPHMVFKYPIIPPSQPLLLTPHGPIKSYWQSNISLFHQVPMNEVQVVNYWKAKCYTVLFIMFESAKL